MMNQNTSSLIALLVSVFFAGSYLRGEIGRRAEMKAELRSMKEQQERTMAMVDSLNQSYSAKKLEFLEMNKKLYSQLDTLLDLKMANSAKLRDAVKQVNESRILLENDISELKGINEANGIKNTHNNQ